MSKGCEKCKSGAVLNKEKSLLTRIFLFLLVLLLFYGLSPIIYIIIPIILFRHFFLFKDISLKIFENGRKFKDKN